MRFASLCMAWCAVGCLTTDKIEFELEEQVPPAISSAPGAMHPLNEIAKVFVTDDGGEFAFEVNIRDVNVNQELQYRLFIDGPPVIGPEFPIVDGEIRPTGFVERTQDVIISFDQLGEPGSCHRFDLLVTGGFASFVEVRRPRTEGDVAQATWWVEVTNAESPVITKACE